MDLGHTRSGLENLWHTERFPWTQHSLLSQFFYFFSTTGISMLWRICVHMHTSNYIETVYELPLLQNNNVGETFVHKSGAVWRVDWIFIISVPAWQWLGDYVILDKTFYSPLFKQEVVTALVTSTFSSICIPWGSHC